MIYVLSRIIQVPGKMAESNEIVAKELMPIYSKLGIQYLASFHSYTGNMNENIALVAYEDLASLQKTREALSKSAAYKQVNNRLNALQVSTTSILIEPNPWSPMK
jgi:hypothetical protein